MFCRHEEALPGGGRERASGGLFPDSEQGHLHGCWKIRRGRRVGCICGWLSGIGKEAAFHQHGGRYRFTEGAEAGFAEPAGAVRETPQELAERLSDRDEAKAFTLSESV